MKFAYFSMLIMLMIAINSLKVNKKHKREDNYQAINLSVLFKRLKRMFVLNLYL